MQDFSITITNDSYNQQTWLDLFLQNLDPSLLQNVILGMLALLVPVGIGILSFFFEERSKEKVESNLELFVLLRQVLKVKYIVLLSLFSLLLLSLYEVHLFFKIFSVIFFIFYIIWLILSPFKNILRWFLENTEGFAINFLKSLDIKKDRKILLSAWQALWLGDGSKRNEKDFTKIFISHIDNSIKCKKLDLAIQLLQNYVNNIEKRDGFSVGYELLPKFFEWNAIFWNEQQSWSKSYHTKKRIQNFFSKKYLQTFRGLALKMHKKVSSKRDRFWNWHYFGGEFFKAIIKTLLKDGHGSYELFSAFKKHTKESMEKLGKIKDKKEKGQYDHYITGLFDNFCPTFFDEIESTPSSFEIWEHYFPLEWKISMTNTKNKIPNIILNEFFKWSQDRIFKNDKKDNFDNSLTEVIKGIFPNVHSSLFTAFLKLLFSSNTKDALEKKSNFHIYNIDMLWDRSIEECEEDTDKRTAELMNAKDGSRKEETINIILNFFSRYWNKLQITLNDDNRGEWESADDKKQKTMLKIARKEKFEKMKTEIESAEIKKLCKDDERKEENRQDFLELINLLLLKIEE